MSDHTSEPASEGSRVDPAPVDQTSVDPAPVDPASVAGTALGANYRLFEILGRGAMGEVYRGRSAQGEAVAVKILRPELANDPAMVARFLQERGILTGLSHANIVRVRDLVAEGTTLAIVMDLVQGQDLRTELTRRGTLPPAEAAAVCAGVLRGLSAVHAVGVVHRDVKPENVLLDGSTIPNQWLPRITDFGVSKFAASTSSRRTSVIGTPDYMAPELIDDSEPTAASDLYAVGIMLYELLCGVTPFGGGSALAVMRKHAEFAPGRPDGIPEPLWALISALLAKDPAQRPASATVAAVALESQLAGLAAVPALTPLTEAPDPDPDGATVLNSLRPARTEITEVPEKRSKRRFIAVVVCVILLLAAGGATAFALRGKSKTPEKGASHTAVTKEVSPSPSATSVPSPTISESVTPSASGTASPTASSASVAVPAVVGKTLADAVAALTALGVKYSTEDVIAEGKPDNTVVSTDPAAGQPTGASVLLSVARAAVGTYLEDMVPIERQPETGALTINGKDYAHGLSADMSYYCDSKLTWEYDLGRDFRQLKSIVGVTDDSNSAAKLLVEVTGDGRTIWSRKVRLGKPERLNVDVSGILRLAIVTTPLTCAGDTRVGLGNPQVIGVAPASTPSAEP